MFQGLNPERYDRVYSDRQLVRRIAAYFVPQRNVVYRIALAVLATTLIGAAQPVIIASSIDAAATTRSTQVIALACGGLALLAVLNWFVNRLRRRWVARLIGELISRMRNDAFAATVRHDMSFFDEFQSGKIVSRITNDTNELSQVAVLLFELISQFTTLILAFIILFRISVPLTLGVIAFAPILILFGYVFRTVARRVARGGFRVIAEVNAAIQEAVAGMRVAKNFRQEKGMYARFDEVNRRSYSVNLRRGFVYASVFPIMNFWMGAGEAAITYFGGLAAGAGSISVGSWYLFFIGVEQLGFPMTNIASFWSQIQNGLSACERIFALIDAESSVKQLTTDGARQMTGDGQSSVLKGEIEFSRVNFRYNSQQQVLDDFSLHIRPGESVALVGHTGAGKSSIIKLITRFYEFQDGEISIDGHDIRALDLSSFRRQLGWVSQSPFLFNDNVMNNIRYAAPELSDTEIERVAQRIGDGEWIDALPNGLQTLVGERGAHLSMGQRQLVALARVLAQKPPIFILDEATASIDPFTERQIQQALDLILSESTSILIAHRLSTVKAADRIIVLAQGKIIEAGNHDALLLRGGHYATLYDTYFRHQSLDYLSGDSTSRTGISS
jgi:ATP-binding cassette subfamily B protein